MQLPVTLKNPVTLGVSALSVTTLTMVRSATRRLGMVLTPSAPSRTATRRLCGAYRLENQTTLVDTPRTHQTQKRLVEQYFWGGNGRVREGRKPMILDYGSEGWGFESLRACHTEPLLRWGFRRVGSCRRTAVDMP